MDQKWNEYIIGQYDRSNNGLSKEQLLFRDGSWAEIGENHQIGPFGGRFANAERPSWLRPATRTLAEIYVHSMFNGGYPPSDKDVEAAAAAVVKFGGAARAERWNDPRTDQQRFEEWKSAVEVAGKFSRCQVPGYRALCYRANFLNGQVCWQTWWIPPGASAVCLTLEIPSEANWDLAAGQVHWSGALRDQGGYAVMVAIGKVTGIEPPVPTYKLMGNESRSEQRQ